MKIEEIASLDPEAREEAKKDIAEAIDGITKALADKTLYAQHRLKAIDQRLNLKMQLLFLSQKESSLQSAIESTANLRAARTMFNYLCELGGEHEEFAKRVMSR